VEAARIDEIDGWQVTVWVMEFVREDPLEDEYRQRMARTLRAVSGVTSAEEQDRETWFRDRDTLRPGTDPAAAQVADELAGQVRAYHARWTGPRIMTPASPMGLPAPRSAPGAATPRRRGAPRRTPGAPR